MFVRVQRTSNAYVFTLVDADLKVDNPVPITILEIGTIADSQLGTWQAWYSIADNLVCADLDIEIKRNAAKDLSEWLPPISRELLIEQRKSDLRGLAELGSTVAESQLKNPIVLSEDDPLTTIADWLNS